MSDHEVGMKVVLSHPKPSYMLGTRNPAIGTTFFCEGTIKSINRGEIRVWWSNNEENTYSPGTLSIVNTEGYVSIWRD